MKTLTVAARPPARKGVVANLVGLTLWAVGAFGLLVRGGSLRWVGLALGLGLVGATAAFVWSFARGAGALKLTPHVIAFGGTRIDLRDLQSVERDVPDPTGRHFRIVFHTRHGPRHLDLSRYDVEPERWEEVFESLRAAAPGDEGGSAS